jgi:hypothetical protein
MKSKKTKIEKLISKYSGTNGAYVTLISVLILSVVAVTIIGSALTVSTDSLISSTSVSNSKEARALIDACAEQALQSIRDNGSYTGEGSVSLGEGGCDYTVIDPSVEYDLVTGNQLWMTFEETSGTAFSDLSPNTSNDGACDSGAGKCPTLAVEGQCGNATEFDGANDIITIASDASLDLTTQGTISAWIYPTTNFTTTHGIVSKANSDNVSGRAYSLHLTHSSFLSKHRALGFNYDGVDGNGTVNDIADSDTVANNWYHLVYTWDASGKYIYIDNVTNAGSPSTLASQTLDVPLSIGRFFDGDVFYNSFQGRIDEVGIWNRVLTTDEIAYLGTSCDPLNLESGGGDTIEGGNVLSLAMDETSGATTFVDSSGNGRDFVCAGSDCPVAEVTGQCGTALEFDGAGDFLEDSDGESYVNGLTDFTVSFWIESDIAATDKGVLATRTPDGNDNGLGFRYDAAGYSGGCTTCAKATKTAGSTQNIETSNSSGTTSWQHVAMVSDGTTGATTMYLNGVADTPTFYSGDVSGALDTSTTVIIGKGYKDSWSSTGWDGKIDQFDIWDSVLSEAEVNEVMDNCGLVIPGGGASEKIIEITSTVGNATRKALISATSSSTGVTIDSWNEVSEF